MNASDPSDMPGRTGDSALQSSGFVDPRSEKDFDPRFYPQGDGVAAPLSESNSRDDRIKLEFCAVYYRLNRLHARLAEMRRHVEALAGDARERDLLQEIEKHLRLRDELEDRYAPYGVIAEVIARDGYAVDIKFTFGDRNVLRQQRTKLISSTALLFFPGPDDSIAKEEEPNRGEQGSQT
jgi:hypothetical protein